MHSEAGSGSGYGGLIKIKKSYFSQKRIFFVAASDTDSRSEASDADAVLEEGNWGRYRYGRRMNRLVRDIASSLDPANYALIP